MQDLTKRTEKLSADCKQFEKTYDSAQSWIASATQKLSECSSVGGDKSVIQKQLTKLQVSSILTLASTQILYAYVIGYQN